MIVCERVSGNIVFLLVSVRGAQLSLTVCLPWTRLAFQFKYPQWLRLIFVKFTLCNQIIWQWVRLIEISLAYLVNVFYETGLEALEVRRQVNLWFAVCLNQRNKNDHIFSIASNHIVLNRNRIPLHRNSIALLAASYVSSMQFQIVETLILLLNIIYLNIFYYAEQN